MAERCEYLCGDRGLDDGKLVTRSWDTYQIKPVIDIRNCWKDPDETKLVPGTENVVQIVGLGAACRIAARDLDRNVKHMKQTRDRLFDGIREACDVRLNGHPDLRLPNTLNLSFRDVTSDDLIAAVSDTVAVSAGSACHSDTVKLSPVIEAIGVPMKRARGTIRFSTGKYTTDEEIDCAAAAIVGAWQALTHHE